MLERISSTRTPGSYLMTAGNRYRMTVRWKVYRMQ